MPYYRNQDVICWVKVYIVECYEGAGEEQKADLRKDWKEFVGTKAGRYEIDKYKWAWNMIAVPFGIEDTFPETFLDALRNSWEAAGNDPDHSFSDELQELFDEDATERCCWNCDKMFEIDPDEDEEDEDTCQGCRTIPNLNHEENEDYQIKLSSK